MTRGIYKKKRIWALAVLEDQRLSTNAKAIGVYLVEKYLNNATGEAWPSHESLANNFGVSKRTVQRAISTLASHGWLKINRAKRKANTYRISHPNRRKIMQLRETNLSFEGGQDCPPNQRTEPIDYLSAKNTPADIKAMIEGLRKGLD